MAVIVKAHESKPGNRVLLTDSHACPNTVEIEAGAAAGFAIVWLWSGKDNADTELNRFHECHGYLFLSVRELREAAQQLLRLADVIENYS